MSPPRTLGRRARRCTLSVALVAALTTLQLSAPPVDAGEQEWIPPVDGRVVAPFREPVSRYGAGHRGVDFAAAPGAAVRAANDGRVSFAGDVAGSVHVVVAHDGGIRTSYSFLSRVDVGVGQQVRKGQIVGAAGGTGEGHGPGVLHFGVRIGERYVDPMLLLRPPDLTEIVRLVPAGERAAAGHKTPEEEVSELLFEPPGHAEHDDCAGGIPFAEQLCDGVEEVAEAGADVAEATWDLAEAAFEEGLDALRILGQKGIELARSVAEIGRELLAKARDLTIAAAEWFLDSTRLGRMVKSVVEAGLFILEALTSECTTDAPPADSTGGSGNVMLAVGGIDSHRERGDRRSFDFPAGLLGYDKSEQEWFSYRGSSEEYRKQDTYQDIRRSARLLAEQLKDAAREHPGRTFDLFGHSQGGVVIDVFLTELYAGHESEYPPIENVVTFASPHEGSPLATRAGDLAANPLGRLVFGGLSDLHDDGRFPGPDPNARSIRQLSQDSSLIEEIQNSDLPQGIHFLSIGAIDDALVPADNVDRPGATTIRLDVGTLFDSHSAVTRSPRALMAARAAIEHKLLPCTSYHEKVQGAVAPALFSALEREALEPGL